MMGGSLRGVVEDGRKRQQAAAWAGWGVVQMGCVEVLTETWSETKSYKKP